MNVVLQGVTIVIATIGRLVHFVDDGIISYEKLRYLVLDEADRMLELDKGFQKDILGKVAGHESMPVKEKRQTLMFRCGS